MNYTEAIQFLQGLQLFGAKLGLENTLRLAACAGNPQNRLRFIHVAGTNGKGSTCAFLESIYRSAGFRLGLYTSPHLIRFGERIQVNRELIPESEIARLATLAQEWIRDFPPGAHPTFFEVVTVMALRYFAEQRCDLVIWETGMGGRLDATNIVTPVASVITNVQLDHQQWLGDTLEQIAREKAGIIKPGVPVFTAAEPGAGLEVIAAIAKEQGAPLTVVHREEAAPSSLRGTHQRRNAALARAVTEAFPVAPEHIAKGLASTHWPGRLQLIERPNGQKLLLDGAHNPAGIRALCAELARQTPAVVFGALRDKNWQEMLTLLAGGMSSLMFTPIKTARTLMPEDVVPFCQKHFPAWPIRAHASVADALKAAADEPFVVVTGSLYLVGETLEALGLSPSPSAPERTLNEWSGVTRAAPQADIAR